MVLLMFVGRSSFGQKQDLFTWLIYESRFPLMGMFFKESGVIVRGPDQGMGLNENRERDFIFTGFFFFKSFDQLSDRLARADMTIDGHRAGLLDQRGLVFAGERENAAHLSLAQASLFFEEKKAELFSFWADLFSLTKKALRHPGGIEDPIRLLHLDAPGTQAFDVSSNEREHLLVVDLDLKIVDPDDDFTVDRGGPGRVEGAFHFNAAVIPDSANALLKVSERLEGQFFKMRLFFQKHLLHLPLGPPMDAERGPALLPVHEPLVLFFNDCKLSPFERCVLRMLDRILDGPFPVGVGNTRRIGDDSVMAKHGGINGIQLRLVDVGLQDTFLQIIQDDVLRASAKVPEGFLMKAGESLFG